MLATLSKDCARVLEEIEPGAGHHLNVESMMTHVKTTNSLPLHFILASFLEDSGDPLHAKKTYEDLFTVLQSSIQGADVSKDFGLVVITYMRFVLRTEGLPAVRKVFSRARSVGNLIPWIVYEVAAKMEDEHGGYLQSSLEIFESGMDRFSDDVEFVVCYLDWLLCANEQARKQNLCFMPLISDTLLGAIALVELVKESFSGDDATRLQDYLSQPTPHRKHLKSAVESRIEQIYGPGVSSTAS
jgi:hypothetical protein